MGAAVTFTAPVILDYRNNAWKLNPTAQYAAGGTERARDVRERPHRGADAPTVGGDLKVASFNVLNYFTTLGADAAGCTSPSRTATGDPVDGQHAGLRPARRVGPGGPRPAAGQDRRGDQRARRRRRRPARDRELGRRRRRRGRGLGTLVDALNAAAGSDVWAFVPSSTRAARRRRRWTSSPTRSSTSRPPSSGSATSRALGTQSDRRRGVRQRARADRPRRSRRPAAASRSWSSSTTSSPRARPARGPATPTGRRPGRVERVARRARPTALRDWVPTVQEPAPSRSPCVGDFNSYTLEDPLQMLYDAGYTDVRARCRPGEYSYSFGGLSGSLDHVLLNARRCARATGADIWEINAEESIALEYSRYNYHGTDFYDATPTASSDHDPVVVAWLDAGEPTGPVDLTLTVTPSSQVYGPQTAGDHDGDRRGSAGTASRRGSVPPVRDGETASSGTAPVTDGVAYAGSCRTTCRQVAHQLTAHLRPGEHGSGARLDLGPGGVHGRQRPRRRPTSRRPLRRPRTRAARRRSCCPWWPRWRSRPAGPRPGPCSSRSTARWSTVTRSRGARPTPR